MESFLQLTLTAIPFDPTNDDWLIHLVNGDQYLVAYGEQWHTVTYLNDLISRLDDLYFYEYSPDGTIAPVKHKYFTAVYSGLPGSDDTYMRPNQPK